MLHAPVPASSEAHSSAYSMSPLFSAHPDNELSLRAEQGTPVAESAANNGRSMVSILKDIPIEISESFPAES